MVEDDLQLDRASALNGWLMPAQQGERNERQAVY